MTTEYYTDDSVVLPDGEEHTSRGKRVIYELARQAGWEHDEAMDIADNARERCKFIPEDDEDEE